MILQSLDKLYDRLKKDDRYEISRPGFSLQGIGFCVVIRKDGTLDGIEDVRVEELIPQKNGKKKSVRKMKQMQVLGDTRSSGSGLNASFLWDTIGYMLGCSPKEQTEKEAKRTANVFNAFKDLHLSQEKEVNDPAFSAVCRFLEQWTPASADSYPFLKELVGGYGVFRLVGDPDYVHEHDAIQEFFLRKNTAASADSVMGQCMISGKTVPIARLQAQIKGLGKKPAVLVGFNDPAYESYGKRQAFNAPVGEEHAFRYSVALNSLTNGPMKSRHTVSMSDMKVVFWAEKADEMETYAPFLLGADNDSALDEDTRKKLELFFETLRNGTAPGEQLKIDEANRFYILGLSANATRTVVRFFYTSSVGEILRHFQKHFADMQLERNFESEKEFPSIRMILDQTCVLKNGKFPDRDQIPSNMEGLLFYSILSGTPYPAGVYNRILERFKRDSYQDYVKLSFMKAFLIRNHNKELKMSYDPNNNDPAYLCGCLFALFERTQKEALGETVSNIRADHFSSAAASPSMTYPVLFKKYIHHLEKCQNQNKRNFDYLVSRVMEQLNNAFPNHQDVQSQGVFFIGYYHMKNFSFKNKEEKDKTLNAVTAE